MTEITIPSGVKNIGEYAFYGTDNLKDVTYLGTETQWNKVRIQAYNEALLSATMHYTNDSNVPDNPSNPDNPGEPDIPSPGAPSEGGDGAGAILLIGGVLAVTAATAIGVVLFVPVERSGNLYLSGEEMANATVQVLKNDTVVAETTADADGHFTIKARRGTYTLRVQGTNARGELVTRYVENFRLPAQDISIGFAG